MAQPNNNLVVKSALLDILAHKDVEVITVIDVSHDADNVLIYNLDKQEVIKDLKEIDSYAVKAKVSGFHVYLGDFEALDEETV